MRTLKMGILAGCMLLLGFEAAMAKTYTPKQMKGMCDAGGGLYIGQKKGTKGPYGCLTQGGDLVLCGGHVAILWRVSHGRTAAKQLASSKYH
jgi:hypothetical protein